MVLHPLNVCAIVVCACLQDGDCFFTRLLKIDVVSKTSQEWKEEGTFPGEPIFVPHPEASQEDQGVLLSVVLAGQFCTCNVLVALAPCCVSAHALHQVLRGWRSAAVFLARQTQQQNVTILGPCALRANVLQEVACVSKQAIFACLIGDCCFTLLAFVPHMCTHRTLLCVLSILLQLYGIVLCIGIAGDMQAVTTRSCIILPAFGSCMLQTGTALAGLSMLQQLQVWSMQCYVQVFRSGASC